MILSIASALQMAAIASLALWLAFRRKAQAEAERRQFLDRLEMVLERIVCPFPCIF